MMSTTSFPISCHTWSSFVGFLETGASPNFQPKGHDGFHIYRVCNLIHFAHSNLWKNELSFVTYCSCDSGIN